MNTAKGEYSRNKADLTGQRFGMLTVLRPSENIGAQTAWWCRCDCGQELAVKSLYLYEGRTKHCGCQGNHSRKKLDLTGQRFGMLTVLRPSENIGTRTAWWCKCDCGQELAVKTEYLRNGHATHCGCQYITEQEASKKQNCRIDRWTRTQDFTGQRFGALTAISRAEKVNGYLAWNCRCDCGREIVVQAVHLCRGRVRNCGCGRGDKPAGTAGSQKRLRPSPVPYRDTRKQDMTGRRFGTLTVLRSAENINGRTAWVCRCDCGTELVVRSEYLRRGVTKSCGCQAVGSNNKRIDLAGQRFGKLVALRPAEKLGRETAWWCRCDCGREIVASTGVLREGKTKSCGCDLPPPQRDENKCFPATLHMVDGTCVEVLRNKKLRRNNVSGVTGVYWSGSAKCWVAAINFKGQRYYLGSYRRFEDAVKARKLGEEKYHDAFLEAYDKEQGVNSGISAQNGDHASGATG